MADVYKLRENILRCIQGGVHYYGFLKGSESQIEKQQVVLYGNTISPGDKIVGFDSGNVRTSFQLKSGYMIYMGIFEDEILFDIYDPKAKPVQRDLFNERPKWFISFSIIGPNSGLLMQSSSNGFYDIHPRKIIYS